MIDQKTIHQIFTPELRQERGTHAGLWLDKYLLDQQREDTKSRRELVDEVAQQPEPAEYLAFFTRWQAILKDCRAQTRKVRVRGRMVIGLGSESLLEASISLHRTYGVPYIPASALKGLAASYAHHRLGDEWRKGGMFHRVVFAERGKQHLLLRSEGVSLVERVSLVLGEVCLRLGVRAEAVLSQPSRKR